MKPDSNPRMSQFLEHDLLFVCLLLGVVSVASFGLGRLSERSLVPAREIAPAVVTMHESESLSDTQTVVVSKNGTKYHLPWCPGAKQMNENNKVYYANTAEAEAAGYSAAGNCPGL